MSELLEEVAPDTFENNKDIIEAQQDGFLTALITAGLTPLIAGAVISALSNDEEVTRLLLANKRPLIFMTQQDSKVDDEICLPKQGDVWAEDDPRRPRIPFSLHPNCLLPGTMVESDKIISALRVFYDGPIIEITSAHGRKLTVTPNHMILTPHGFVAADFLRKGDNMINCLDSQRPILSINPDNNRGPTTIQQVFDSLSKSTGMTTTSMPSSTEDLHNDGNSSKGNIDIIWSNSLLSNTRKPSFFKHILTKFFNRSNSYLSFLSRKRSLTLCLNTLITSSDRIMSGTRKTSSFFSGRLRHTQIHGSTSSSGSNTILLEMFDDVSPTTLKNLRQGLDRFSSIIQLDEIVNINVKSYSGFVYDLQTESTLYSGNSIILSNCRCFWQDAITGKNLGQF